jgi:hypothetical protein
VQALRTRFRRNDRRQRPRRRGQPVLVVNDTFIIAGCPFTVGTKYQGCVKITWIVRRRVKVGASSPCCRTAPASARGEQIPTARRRTRCRWGQRV